MLQETKEQQEVPSWAPLPSLGPLPATPGSEVPTE